MAIFVPHERSGSGTSESSGSGVTKATFDISSGVLNSHATPCSGWLPVLLKSFRVYCQEVCQPCRVRLTRFFFGVLLAVSVACSSGSDSGSTTTPTTPPLAPTTETFTGTVPVAGSDVHSFVVNLSNGQVTAVLTAAGPPPTIPMGLALGSMSNGSCTPFQNGFVITPAGPAAAIGGTGFPAGTYCVMVSDVGRQTADVTYSVTVTHY